MQHYNLDFICSINGIIVAIFCKFITVENRMMLPYMIYKINSFEF